MASTSTRSPARPRRTLAARLLQAHEAERRHLARVLHDDIGQQLALLALGIDRLRQQVPGSLTDAAEELREELARAREIASRVQRLSHALCPSRLEHLGLAAALRGLGTELAREHGIAVQVTCDDVTPALDADAALALFRVAEEALRNAVQHSGADSVVVTLIAETGRVRLTVADAGRGFETARVAAGVGFARMKHGMMAVGGRVAIASARRRGTRIEATVPLPPRE